MAYSKLFLKINKKTQSIKKKKTMIYSRNMPQNIPRILYGIFQTIP